MAEFQNTIDVIGDDVATKRIVYGTIEEYNDDVIAIIGSSAFHSCSNLTSVDMPNVTSIGNYAFSGCSNLTNINIPNVTSVGNQAFYSCSKLASVNMPNVTSIGNKAFSNCSNLTNINIPNVTSVESDAFGGCSNLTNIDMPNVTSIGNGAFYGCTILKTVILRNNAVCTLSNTNAFGGTPFASGKSGGTLLVPRALVESYKTATNWSVIWGYGHNQFLALEDYTVDGTITGAIDWDKLNGGTT